MAANILVSVLHVNVQVLKCNCVSFSLSLNTVNVTNENMDDTLVDTSTNRHVNVTGYDEYDDDELCEETDNLELRQPQPDQTIETSLHDTTMHNLAEDEMRYRVKESKYRSECQLIQLEKAREELKHLQDVHEMELAHKREMNRLEMQSAKFRYANLMNK